MMSAAFGLGIANYSHVRVDAHGNEALLDQELSYSSILFRKFAIGDSVSQLHVTASQRNLEIIRNLGVKCIVTQRNLFDTAVSLRDNFVKTTPRDSVVKKDNLYKPGQGVFFRMSPFNELRRARLGTEAEQYDYIIDYLMPWYFQFYGSWIWAERRVGLSLLRVSYDNLATDPLGSLSEISRFFDVPMDTVSVRERLAELKNDNISSNYNVGRSGRGKEKLTRDQQERLKDIGSRYMDPKDFGHLV